MRTSVLLAYEAPILREALRKLLEARGDVEVVGEVPDGAQAVALAQKLRPDLVVMDISIPRLSGVEATRQIVESQCGAKVLILCTGGPFGRLEEALRAGASGCLVMDSEPSEVRAAIEAVRQGRCYLSPTVAHLLVDGLGRRRSAPMAQLTDREREVLQLIAEGFSSREIASQLGVAPKTAESYRSNLMAKLGIHKVPGLVRLAIREGLITP